MTHLSNVMEKNIESKVQNLLPRLSLSKGVVEDFYVRV